MKIIILLLLPFVCLSQKTAIRPLEIGEKVPNMPFYILNPTNGKTDTTWLYDIINPGKYPAKSHVIGWLPAYENDYDDVIEKSADTIIPDKKVLLADETWVVSSGKTTFRIICDNEELQKKLLGRFGATINRFSGIPKEDRNGFYWEISYYLDNDQYPIVMSYFKLLSEIKSH